MNFFKPFAVSIVALAFSFHAIGQRDCDFKIDTAKILLNENLDSFLYKIQNETFTVSNDIKDIPAFIKEQLDCWAQDFTIANPKEIFNSTDMRVIGLPDRQLLFLAINKELFIMTYLRGGYAEQTHMLFVKFQGKKIVDVWTGVCLQDLVSKKQILNYIKKFRNKHWGLNTNVIYF